VAEARWDRTGTKEWFLYYDAPSYRSCSWSVSTREHMEAGECFGYMGLGGNTALTPDQARPSEVWLVSPTGSTGSADAPEVQVRRQI
jgi:hypothetical protein